jgi:hypothetical protein
MKISAIQIKFNELLSYSRVLSLRELWMIGWNMGSKRACPKL